MEGVDHLTSHVRSGRAERAAKACPENRASILAFHPHPLGGDKDDSVRRIPMPRLERLLRFDPTESLPQYAGNQVRCATPMVEVEGRRVLSIRNIHYLLLTFDFTRGLPTGGHQIDFLRLMRAYSLYGFSFKQFKSLGLNTFRR